MYTSTYFRTRVHQTVQNAHSLHSSIAAAAGAHLMHARCTVPARELVPLIKEQYPQKIDGNWSRTGEKSQK